MFWFIAFFLMITPRHRQTADLIVYNATVYTVDSSFSTAEAFAVKHGKFIAVGTNESVRNQFSAAETIDAKHAFIFPGFIDAHSHFVEYGHSLFAVNLYDSRDENELVKRVEAFASAHPGETWITGHGWDQNKFSSKQFPTNLKLNELFPDKPVLLSRIDGHAALANAAALQLAGIKAGDTIAGGEIETKEGKLTGILIDNAVAIVTAQMPPATTGVYQKWLTAAEHNCFAQGLTTVSDCGLAAADIDIIDSLQRQGKLHIRVYAMLADEKKNYERFLKSGPYKTDKLIVNSFKLYADGALGSRGACLLQPYADKDAWYGFLLSNPSHFDSVAAVLIKTNFQMCTHAIGDSGNRVILNIYNKYLQGSNDRRWRIEHAQVVNRDDLEIFSKSNIIPSVQPTHATSDMYWAQERLGSERIKEAYAYKYLLEQNGWLPLGTDFPVEDISPFKTFLAAVYRVDATGFPSGGFQPENSLTKEQAIRGITIWAAKAGFMEQETGSIEVGKSADFIFLDKDLMNSSQEDILHTKVLKTFIDGNQVYSLK